MIIQASFWSAVLISIGRRKSGRSEVKNPPMIRTQSRQKYAVIPIAVATWRPTTIARYGDSGLETSMLASQLGPIKSGISTLWPRLETGKSSVIPWMRPMTTAWKYVKCGMDVLCSRSCCTPRVSKNIHACLQRGQLAARKA
jgi:hypothetical protein